MVVAATLSRNEIAKLTPLGEKLLRLAPW